MSQRSASEIYAEIEKLQALGSIEHWNGHRASAEQLLKEAVDHLPEEDDEDDDAPMDLRLEWLWDQLDPIVEPAVIEPEVVESSFVDAENWAADSICVLTKGWQQFNRFSFLSESDSETDGDLVDQATNLWLLYDDIDPLQKGERFFELHTIWSQLEQHIDPDGIFHKGRQQCFNNRRAAELREQGKHKEAEQWLLPKDQLERPSDCSQKEWANIIKPFNRREYDEPIKEFFARVELARAGLMPGKRGSEDALKQHLEDAHTVLRQKIEEGVGEPEIQQLINQRFPGYNQTGLAKFAEQCRIELERRQDLNDALEDLMLRGAPPAIDLSDYVPAEWVPMFRILRDGLKFSDEAVVMTMMAGVAAMFPPQVRITGWSLEEIPTIWLFHIGTSGTAKSVLLKHLINQPMLKPIAAIDAANSRDHDQRDVAAKSGEELPQFRKRNLIYTAPTTQGIRADLAVHGDEVPGLLVRDELNGWLKQMADEGGAGVGDIEFWLSSYDGAYSNDVFADAKKSREVRQGKLAVIGGIQPKVFLEQLEAGNANGFNSRPLFVHLPRIKRTLMKGDEHTDQLHCRLGELYLAALQDSNSCFVLSSEAEQMFEELFNQLEELSLQANSEEVEALWAKGPGQVLRVAAAVHFMRVATGMEDLVEQGFVHQSTVVSTRSLQLAANLVMAGKTRAVELHERAANPMLERADKLLESARKRQGKAEGKGVPLSEIRKGWSSRDRPTMAELKQLAAVLATRGLVQLLNGDKSIRVVR